MKIFVTYANEEKQGASSTFIEAVEYLRKQGHNVKQDTDHRKGLKNDAKSYAALQLKIEKSIKDADIVIAEISTADSKVGFDIATALNEKKVVIAMEKEGKEDKFVTVFHGNKVRNLLVKKYNAKNVIDVVTDAVEEAKSKLDTKFILIISPEIDRYLDWASQTKRMHKAQIVRNAVESILKKDKDYKAYLA